MSNGIALGANMRANLLSLQNTNSLLDSTQLKLSTGRKVNSALDNAQSFFAAQSLNNRASDLGRLLDGMGQSIQTIKQADNSVTAMTKLVEQADSIVTQARDSLAKGSQEARVAGNVSLKGKADLTTVSGLANGNTMTFSITDKNGAAVTLNASGVVTLATGDSADQLVTKINDLNTDPANKVIEAKLNDQGQLEIAALNGNSFSAKFEATAGGEVTASNLAVASALGFGGVAEAVADGTAGNNDVRITSKAAASLTSIALFSSVTGGTARASDTLDNLRTAAGGATKAFDTGATLTSGDKILVGVNGSMGTAITINNETIAGLVDKINNDSTLKGKIAASFDGSTGQINIRALSADVKSVKFGIEEGTAAETSQLNLGLGVAKGTGAQATGAATQFVESIRLGQGAGDLARMEKDFNNIRTQIDSLANDAGYRGTNLLKGDDLNTVFNEDRSTSITTKGATFTSAGLGLSAANFASITTADGASKEVRSALSSVRDFGSSLANDLSVIQTRQDFTKSSIDTLNEGADKLTLADMNEEGAKMLALQTRLQLGVQSLSLASQSSQSVLRLF